MGADQFLLTWNNHRSNFAEVFSQLRFQDQLVDVTLLCDGGSYPAHRLVLAACSPYFHQLFTKLPTQHPLVYLRDVRQAELEALLEFIYRGEVSVANSELTGLIKIAESLRIKGLGDVSQRDPTPNTNQTYRDREKRPCHFAGLSSQSNRPNKSARYFYHNENKDYKVPEVDFSSLLSSSHQNTYKEKVGYDIPTFPYSHFGAFPFFHSMDNVENTEEAIKESKLRSCLEGQDIPTSMSYNQFLASAHSSASPTSKKPMNQVKKEHDPKFIKKKVRSTKDSSGTNENCTNQNEVLSQTCEPKQEPVGDSAEDCGSQAGDDVLPNIRGLCEPSDLGQSILTRLLKTWQNQSEDANFPTVTEQNAKDAKLGQSLTCQLCGATIKHIANFRRHMKQHLNPRRFPCPWCNAAFGRKDNLKTHTRKHHPAEVEAQENTVNVTTIPLEGSGGEESHVVENGMEGESSQAFSVTPKIEDENQAEEGLIIAEDEDFEGEDDIGEEDDENEEQES